VTYFDNVQGLIPGAPIRLAGKDVGTVENVLFSDLGEGRPPVQVDLLVEEAVQHRIREDSLATIATIGLLGDKYVEISMGTPAAQVLPPPGRCRPRARWISTVWSRAAPRPSTTSPRSPPT
jgi:phospholipid/cholesterol/gamma-HCH transport system substrate-binding protein